jgi:hypothetical protein
MHIDCVYEDLPPDSPQSPPSPPTGSIVSTRMRDAVSDTSIETGDPTSTTQPVGAGATAVQLPSPMSLRDFRPLLLTDYEDPLLYALSDISLEDMNISLCVSLPYTDNALNHPQPPSVLRSPSTVWSLFPSSQTASDHSGGYIRHRGSPLFHIFCPASRLSFLPRT